MASVKKTLLTATITAALTCSVAALAFYSSKGFSQESERLYSQDQNQEQSGATDDAGQNKEQETIGQSIGRSIDDAITNFSQFYQDVDKNWDSISKDLKKSLDQAAQTLSDAADELNASIKAAQDQGYTPENPNKASRSSDPYGFIEFMQNSTLSQTASTATLGELVNTYSHCELRSKHWDYFRTTEGEHLISFSCTLSNAPTQVQELSERTDVKISSTLSEIGSGISSLFSSEESADANISAQEKEQAQVQSLKLKDASLVAMFTVSKKMQQVSFKPQDFYLNIHFADDTRGEIPLQWSHISCLGSNQPLIPSLTQEREQALNFKQALYQAYLGLENQIL